MSISVLLWSVVSLTNILFKGKLFVASLSTSKSFIHTSRRRQYQNTRILSDINPLYSFIQEENNEGESRSIGNIVGNLHGGKYQFDSPGSSVNRIGQEFAESLYSSSYDDDDNQQSEDDEPWPKWAIRKLITSPVLPTTVPTLALSSSSFDEQQKPFVRITNQERTWERFYTKILYFSGEETFDPDPKGINIMPFQVTPTTGVLAPSGGASNACDATKPYSDSSILIVQIDSNKSFGDTIGNYYLVACTEEETWCWKIIP